MTTFFKTAAIAFVLSATAATAQGYQAISDKATFLATLGGKNLSNRLYGVNLAVSPAGQIAGTGAGWEITGTWSWQNGYFCREMNWGGDVIPYNCQLVEFNGQEMRFTTDQGAGDSASFKLR
ncbi:dihydrodipicolinate reductase [Rhodobacteraceae bacterium S2214]|nr:dihydrodipicolinate reductase [Rhodobacteraceae bacterium S2214]